MIRAISQPLNVLVMLHVVIPEQPQICVNMGKCIEDAIRHW